VVQLETSSYLTLDARIANPPPDLLAKYTRREQEFFFDYANFMLRIFDDAAIRQRLRRILAIEEIKILRDIDVRIMVFPARSLPGRSKHVLHGSYNQTTSQITLYPLKISKLWIRTNGQFLFRRHFDQLSDIGRKILCEIALSGLGTLIHEFLHVKFEHAGMGRYSEEAVVRKLEHQHMREWGTKLEEDITNILAG